MQEIIMTSFSQQEFLEQRYDKNLQSCYLCRKTEEEKVALINENGVVFVRIELKPFAIKIMNSDLLAKFLLCQNCYLLVDTFSKEVRTHMRLFNRMNVREGGNFYGAF